MAQTTSALWKTLLRDADARREYAFDINGVWYGPEAEVSHSVESSLFEQFGIGNAMSATLTLSLYADEIPRGAVIKRYVRLTNGIQTSEWLPKGVFFTNRRANEDGYWTVEAYDAMLMADFTWTPQPGFTFPCTMEAAARDIAKAIGLELDPRNVYLPYQMKEYPVGEYMRRDALCDIAAAHGGNWHISDAGKLRLVPLISFPPETSYLVTEHGDAITFGKTRILVSPQAQVGENQIGVPGAAKHYVGLDITGFENNGKRPPIESVTLQVDGANVVTAGAYGGHDLYALCPYATQDMANAILLKVYGYEYQAFTADGANIDPAAELGDGVDVGGLYSVISAVHDTGDGYLDISAPGEAELEDEYPYRNETKRDLAADVDTLRAFIQKAFAEQQLSLNLMKTDIQEINTKVDGILGRLSALEARVTILEGKVN
ncbi:MAG: hypothetical protein K2K53_03955 [Oscillospiraceae bacterium]|nr:hypothetical protein [Oscillospiraceae bacterium]